MSDWTSPSHFLLSFYSRKSPRLLLPFRFRNFFQTTAALRLQNGNILPLPPPPRPPPASAAAAGVSVPRLRVARSLEQERRKMVLWELTALTAYFLGLKRTYRLALRIQRRLIGPKHPRIRDFVYRRTRDVFGVAVSVHKNIQQRDLEVGRNLGNTTLRWLDRMKPSAEIRPRPPGPPNGSSEHFKKISSTSRSAGSQKAASKTSLRDFSGKMLFSRLNIRPKSFPVLPTMTLPNRISASSQGRRISYSPFPSVTTKRKLLMEGVFRKDIAQLMV